MYNKLIYKTLEGFGFKILKDGVEYHKQEQIPSLRGFKPIPTNELANQLADEMVEYLTIIEGQ